MSLRVASIVASLVLASCSFSPSGGPLGDDDAPRIDAPDHDAPGDGPVADAPADAPTDAPTDAGLDACVDVCDEQTGVISSCGAVIQACAAGCTSMDSPSGTGVHCKQLVPSNSVAASDLVGADADIVLMAGRLYIFNTGSGEIRHYPLDGTTAGTLVRAANVVGLDATSKIRWRPVTQAVPAGSMPAVELSIFAMKSLTIPATTVVRPIGPRAVALVAGGAMIVAGEVDVGGGRFQSPFGSRTEEIPGPGGGRGAIDTNPNNVAQGCAAGGNGARAAAVSRDTGGGGGGFGTAGGNGGPASATVDFGGAAVAMPAAPCAHTNLVPLRGGSGGGSGTTGPNGGGGGGALQLTSFTSISIAAGTLYAGGAGGDGSGADGGGGGGGAGGGVLLEAPQITIAGGSLTATGGAGGAGNSQDEVSEYGQRDGTAAEPLGNGGRGGTGANAGAGELQAQAGAGNVDGTGGGGGGAGVLHLRSIAAPAITSGPTIRPTAGTSTAASQ